MTDEMMKIAAQQVFGELKIALRELERRGFRPAVLTHDNGMVDELRIDDAHATTPEVDRIRAEKSSAREAHAA